MKKKILFGILSVFLFFLIALAAGLGWVLGTTDGARWLLGEISSRTAVRIEAGKVTGRLWDDLRMEDLHVRWSNGGARLGAFRLQWRPLPLLYSRISIRTLDLRDLTIEDNRPEEKTPPNLLLPEIKGYPLRFSGYVRSFRLEGLSYRRMGKTPLRMDMLSAGLTWSRGTLEVNDLKTKATSGRAEGKLSAGFVRTSLKADVVLVPSRPPAKIAQVTIDIDLRGKKRSEMEGTIHVVGRSEADQRLDLRTGVLVMRHSVRLKDLRLTRVLPKGEITGSGEIAFREGGPLINLAVMLSGLDLSPFLHAKTDISGNIYVKGGVEGLQGRFDLSNKAEGVKTVHISGSMAGGRKGMTVPAFEGSWLGGAIKGSAGIQWEKVLSVEASLQGRGLDPSVISKEWTGVINADVTASALLPKGAPLSAQFKAGLLDSRLRGQSLTGEAEVAMEGKDLEIRKLFLQGKGFDIRARGKLTRQVFFSADITDLSGLLPETEGELHTKGWVSRKEEMLAGDITGTGRRILIKGIQAKSTVFSGRLSQGKERAFRVEASFKGLTAKHLDVASGDAMVNGTVDHHSVKLRIGSPKARVEATFSGGYENGAWQGEITGLSGMDPVGRWSLQDRAALSISSGKVYLSPLVLRGPPPEKISVSCELAFHPLQGFVQAEWQNANLVRANSWLKDVQLTGSSSGKVYSRWLKGGAPHISGDLAASGTVTLGNHKFEVKTVRLQVTRDEQKLLASFDARVDKSSEVKGHFSSRVEPGVTLPERGDIDAELHDLDLSLLQSWISPEIAVGGTLSGSLKGKLLPDGRLDVKGDASIANGVMSRHGEKGEVTVSLKTARMNFIWHDQALKGALSLALKEYGHAEGNFEIPLPARLPVKVDKSGPTDISLKGELQEKGLLTAAFPGLVQETHGEVQYGLRIAGTWGKPDITGSVKLSKAGAYIPAGGVRIKDVLVTAHFEEERVIVDSFRAVSGTGKIEGTARITMKDWAVTRYEGTLKGKDFQVMYLPELRVQGSPDLTFEGTRQRLSVRGEIKVPDMLVRESKAKTPVRPSKDVIVVDKEEKPEKQLKMALDIQVKIIFGDTVLVKAEGIDAQLGGSLDLFVRGVNDIRGKGEIRVVKGRYSAYGVGLNIERGRVIFSGQPVRQPNLDVLALRKVENIKAGVVVSGTLQSPIVKLYSDPAMSDTDVLAYVVLGHPLGQSKEQADLVARAAGFLLSASESVVFQNQLKRRLGIDTLDIESAPVTTPSVPGSEGAVSRSLVTVGKYLTPSLYISYGRSLFSDANLFRLRYSFSKHWELQTESGTESGADIFYKIDFK